VRCGLCPTDFAELYPGKFQNKTNGVTPRRWLAFCNPQLSGVITKALGTDEWITDMSILEKLGPMASDAALQKEWNAAKMERKVICAETIKRITGITVPTSSMFDIQIKRIHEYKRQLLNIMVGRRRCRLNYPVSKRLVSALGFSAWFVST